MILTKEMDSGAQRGSMSIFNIINTGSSSAWTATMENRHFALIRDTLYSQVSQGPSHMCQKDKLHSQLTVNSDWDYWLGARRHKSRYNVNNPVPGYSEKRNLGLQHVKPDIVNSCQVENE